MFNQKISTNNIEKQKDIQHTTFCELQEYSFCELLMEIQPTGIFL